MKIGSRLLQKSIAILKTKLLAGNDHVIDIFTSEDMENISLCIFQYLTVNYIINLHMLRITVVVVKILSKSPYLGFRPQVVLW